MTKKGDAQLDIITVLNSKFQLSTVYRFWVMRTYKRHDEINQNGFRDGQNGYFHWNLKTEIFRDYNTSFITYREVKTKNNKIRKNN